MNGEDSQAIGTENATLRRRGRNNQTYETASESTIMVPNAHCVDVSSYNEISLPDLTDDLTHYSSASNNHRSFNKKKVKISSENLSEIALSQDSNILTDESTYLNSTQCTSQKRTQTGMCEIYSGNDEFDEDDRKILISPEKQKTYRFESEEDHNHEDEETSCTIALQITFPFLMAGLGMVAAGLILDKVQHWEVFEKVSEVFILVPALLGLKGNLEMTLASRLSTVAHLGHLDDTSKKWKIIWGNMALVEAQAMVVAFIASLFAMVLGWIPDGKWETNHALILCAGSLLTGAIASGILGGIMIFVIMLSRKCGINPDNVATPIAASLGDLTTLSLLAGISQGLYAVLLNPRLVWTVWAIIIFFVVLTPFFVYISYRNEYTNNVIKNGWFPIIAAMGISSLGGFILDFAVSSNPGVAVFAPVINGVGGNFVAVQSSRLSTYLHKSKYPLGTFPPTKSCDCVTPCFLFCGKGNLHARSARVMWFMVIPGQLIFLLTINLLQAGHTTISPQFVAVYLFVSLVQVGILLFVCHSLVHRLWRSKQDPDNCAIPYLTALGDLLGTGLLALGFLFLWAIGDRDMDVGD